MKIAPILTILLMVLCPLVANGQKPIATATYVDDDNNTVETSDNISGQAPLDVTFRATVEELGIHTPTYEWHFRKEGDTQDILVRYEEQTQYTFVESGTFLVTMKTRLTDNDMDLDSVTIKVTISESRLEFPNAFSPNNDGINEKYGAMGVNDPNSSAHWKSIVEFHAYIFNRWGQKLYEWHDPAGYWDGTYKGHDVKEGVYYVLVKARGADGRKYEFKKDVNLLRGYTEGTSNNSETSQ